MQTNPQKGPYVLVYQVGIANLFDCTQYARPSCILQSDYRTCENVARGLCIAGASVIVSHCDMAGDCSLFDWQPGPGSLWSDKKHPPVGSRSATSVIAGEFDSPALPSRTAS